MIIRIVFMIIALKFLLILLTTTLVNICTLTFYHIKSQQNDVLHINLKLFIIDRKDGRFWLINLGRHSSVTNKANNEPVMWR